MTWRRKQGKHKLAHYVQLSENKRHRRRTLRGLDWVNVKTYNVQRKTQRCRTCMSKEPYAIVLEALRGDELSVHVSFI